MYLYIKGSTHIILQFLIYLLVEMFAFFTIPEMYPLQSARQYMPNLTFIPNIIVYTYMLLVLLFLEDRSIFHTAAVRIVTVFLFFIIYYIYFFYGHCINHSGFYIYRNLSKIKIIQFARTKQPSIV